DRPPELRGVGANQATDQLGLLGGAVRFMAELETPSDPIRQAAAWRTTAARAHGAATGDLAGPGLAGPVHLDLPYRDPLAPDPPSRTGAPTPTGRERDDPGSRAETSGAVAGRRDGRPWVALPEPPAP